MPRRSSILVGLALVTVVASGCNVASRAGRQKLIGAGLVMAAVGVGLTIAVGENPPSGDDCFISECLNMGFEHQTKLYGAMAVAGAGVLLAIVGAASSPPEEAPAPIASQPEPTVGVDVNALAIASARMNATSSAAARARPLPEIATDATTLQLAKQARSAAIHLDCSVADSLLGQIASRDVTYSAALVANGVVAPCR